VFGRSVRTQLNHVTGMGNDDYLGIKTTQEDTDIDAVNSHAVRISISEYWHAQAKSASFIIGDIQSDILSTYVQSG
jgi:hypothetical protein